MKVSLRHFLVLFDGSNKDGAEIGGRCRGRASVGHSTSNTRESAIP
jgi:hypothetical protein